MMETDKELHPMMKPLLKLLRKTRTPYILLAVTKEIILVPEKELHLERVLQPQAGGYVRIDWTEDDLSKSMIPKSAEYFLVCRFSNLCFHKGSDFSN